MNKVNPTSRSLLPRPPPPFRPQTAAAWVPALVTYAPCVQANAVSTAAAVAATVPCMLSVA